MARQKGKKHFRLLQVVVIRIIGTAATVGLLLHVSCTRGDNPVVTDSLLPVSLIPLHRGNTWKYKYTFYDQDGKVTGQAFESTQLIEDTVYEGERWFGFGYGGGFVPEWLTVRDDGIYGRRIDLSRPYLVFKYPVKFNESFRGGGFGVDSLVVTGTNVEITVPMGLFYRSFSCVQYTNYPGPNVNLPAEEISCAPQVGIVRWRYFALNYHGGVYMNMQAELVEFNVVDRDGLMATSQN